MSKLIGYAAIVSILLFGCSNSTDSSSFDEGKIRVDIVQRMTDYQNAIKTMEWETVSKMYAEDPRFYYIEDGTIAYESKAAVLSAMKGIGESVDSIEMNISEPEITILSEDLAVVSATYKQQMVFQNGYELPLAGAFTLVLIRQDGSWNTLIGHNSTLKPRSSE